MTPVKPFETYKWHWLSFQPTEGLLNPPVFLGVLRALAKHEHKRFSDQELYNDLQVVDEETRSSVTLARNPTRNLFRNSGQYWKGTGLLRPTEGLIELTELGKNVANSKITQGEFAAIMVQQTVLPNPWTEKPEETRKWREAKLEIKPLALILTILEDLGRLNGLSNAYIRTQELIRIIIPAAGAKLPASEIAKYILMHRDGEINIDNWPDCAPEANDKRMAREFLLFLAHYGLCRKVAGDAVDQEKYYLDELFDIQALSKMAEASIFADENKTQEVVDAIRHSPLPSIIERQRVMTTVLSRPGQAKFRRKILKAFNDKCFITGDVIPEILEAAHIVPVNQHGADDATNGLCLRVDIHRLFDSGNIRIKADGEMVFSEAVKASLNYKPLPIKVNFPDFINPVNLEWREKYY